MIHNFSFDQRHTTLLGEITISINASHPILCYIFNHYLPLFYFILYSLILSHPIPSHLLRPFLRTSYKGITFNVSLLNQRRIFIFYLRHSLWLKILTKSSIKIIENQKSFLPSVSPFISYYYSLVKFQIIGCIETDTIWGLKST